MGEKLECPICGAPTRVYMGNARKDKLCSTHANDLKAGKIKKCEDCGEWHSVNKKCSPNTIKYTELPTKGFDKCLTCGVPTSGYAFCKDCWKKYDSDKLLDILNGKAKPDDFNNNGDKNDPIREPALAQKPVTQIKKQEEPINIEQEANNCIVINESNKSKCITCGRKADGLLFCPSCYHKYKNKDLLFRITECSSVELLDADYEGRYTCKDGHIVKSKSEREIDNYLFENGISHAYEKELPYGATEKETLHPDFYLPNYLGKGKHVYIEHWGYNENNIHYNKTKKFKMPIYKSLCDKGLLTIICTYEKTDTGKIDAVLERKLNKSFIKENTVNFEE